MKRAVCVLVLLPLALKAQAPEVQYGIRITPDTVTIGDPFVVTIRILAPHGAKIELPVGPDSSNTVEMLDPRAMKAGPDSVAHTEMLTAYRMAAWDIGDQPVLFPDAIVTTADGERHVPFGGLKVFVRSVLPKDTALRVPKPARDIITAPRSLWWLWALLALLAALLAWFLWWWFHRRKKSDEVVVDPYEVAEKEFTRIESLGLIDAGERGRFVALMVEVLRDYMSARVPRAASSLTSTELLSALRSRRDVPLDRLSRVLNESDLVKFARRQVTPERAREMGIEVRTIVRDLDAAIKAAEVAAAEAAARASTQQKAAA